MTKERLIRTLILCAIGLVIGAGIGLYQVSRENAQVTQKPAAQTGVAGVQVGGKFKLVDHHGNTVTQDDYAGQYKLVFFGFTSCPMICPTALAKIADAMAALGEDAQRVTPLFITVDPERDDVETMRAYVEQFHPRIIGLTGSRKQIDKAIASYRVFAQKTEDPELSDYTMDHSAYMYFMRPDDKLIKIFRMEDSADTLVQDIRREIAPQ